MTLKPIQRFKERKLDTPYLECSVEQEFSNGHANQDQTGVYNTLVRISLIKLYESVPQGLVHSLLAHTRSLYVCYDDSEILRGKEHKTPHL